MGFLNASDLDDVFQMFQTSFNMGFRNHVPQWSNIATTVPSNSKQNRYGWIGQFPKLREWIGDRHIEQMTSYDYTLVNKKYEATITVPRDDFDDDNVGVYNPLFEEMGYAAAQYPDERVAEVLEANELGYDGLPFFHPAHPVGDGTTYSNVNTSGGGVGQWYLFQTNRPLKPLIWQERQAVEFQRQTEADTSDTVFMKDDYLYGVRARSNVGYGFYQMAYRSDEPLNETTLWAARTTMREQKSDKGRPLGIIPDLLVCNAANELEARKLLELDTLATAGTNINRGLMRLIVWDQLTQ